MVANTRKMHEIKQKLRSILAEEKVLSELFNGLVSQGVVKIDMIRKLTEKSKLHQDEIVELSKEQIMDNPYLQNIEITNIQTENFKLMKKRIIPPRTLVSSGEKTRDLSTMRQINSYIVCNKTLRFPGLIEGESNTCWMTVEPFEINSFKTIIEDATGNVLLLGCGLGYAAYMISQKPDVTSVTIIDNNQEVLDIFTTHILPQFPNKDKVKTIKSDALEYLRTYDLTVYDYINVDIWYDTIDMIFTYLRCLEIEKANPTVKFSYWLENDLKEDIQKAVLSAICDFPTLGYLTDRIGQDIVDETPISNYQDVYNLVDIKNLRELLYRWYCHHFEIVEEYESKDIALLNHIHQTTSMIRNKHRK